METLRRCLPARIRQALDELPETLDETYERILQDIHKEKRKFAHRIFQCVAIASRPLRVEELAEFFAFNFDAGSTPTYRADWRPEDPLDAVLSTCSSMLAVVEVEGSKVIQFSHFSVKEFLTSTRLTEARDTISCYHVSMTTAHTLVAQACLGMLLHFEEDITIDSLKKFPLAEYAAEHWLNHARFRNVSANTQDGMKRLFDPRTHHLAVWVWIFDPVQHGPYRQSTHPRHPRMSCLHYAAFLDVQDVITFLVVECSQNVNMLGDNGTALHEASIRGHLEFARMLIEHGADVNAQDYRKSTPLHLASMRVHVELAQMLLERGADVNAQGDFNSTPLHLALEGGHVDFAQMSLERGADVNAQDNHKSTPLHLALKGGHVDFARMLIERGADVTVQDNYKSTLLHLASEGGHVDFAQMPLERGADVNAQDNYKLTPLHLALKGGHVDFARMLIERGADVTVEDNYKSTPLHFALKGGHVDFAQMLLERGADVTVRTITSRLRCISRRRAGMSTLLGCSSSVARM